VVVKVPMLHRHLTHAVAGWKTARVRRPVQNLGSLDGIETGVRRLIRDEPLETMQIEYRGEKLTIPTEAEMLRIKGVLILQRNATRDYLDFVALADHMGAEAMIEALRPFGCLYPQPNEESALQQLQIQLATPLPYDLEQLNLAELRTSILAGATGRLSRQCALTVPPCSSIALSVWTIEVRGFSKFDSMLNLW
jgi:hypothetical protein